MALSVAQAIPEHYQRAFADNFEHVIQQQTGKLADRVYVDSFTGKEKVYKDLESLSFARRAGRLTKSTPTQVEGHNRKMSKIDFKCQVEFDRLDDEFLGSLGQPNSEVMQAMTMAWNRTMDQEIINAASGTVYGGVEPYVTQIDLPSSQEVAVNHVKSGGTPANSGLTPQKIIKARAILQANEIDPLAEECVITLNPKAEEDLMAYVETSPNDVWAKMIVAWLENPGGKLFGFTPVMTNNLTLNAGTDVRTVLVYSRSRGIYVAPDRLETHIDVIPTKDHAVQISAYGLCGFMRRYEKTVVEIFCDESP
jgi:hypothetical protein